MDKCNSCIHSSICEELEKYRDPLYWTTTDDKIVCSYYDSDNVVEVVRCKDCKNGEKYVIDNDTFLYKCRKVGIGGFTEDFFCSYGERGTDNDL